MSNEMPSDNCELAEVQVLISGYVQGVFFRAATESEAKALGLTGYVANQPDGSSVKVVAEGNRQNLEALVDYLKVGPPNARVEEVIIDWAAYSGRYSDFSVK
jgi:acylphosphatase